MKIVYLSWFNSGEGSQVHANEFMRAMNHLGHEVIPIELSFQSKKKLALKSSQGNAQSLQLNLFYAIFREAKAVSMNMLRIIRLIKICKQYKPDAIINRYVLYDFSALFVSRLLNIPVLYEVNASAVYEKEIKKEFYFKKLAKKIESNIFKRANVVSVVSQELKNYFNRLKLDTSNTIVVPNGVNLDHYPSIPNVPLPLAGITEEWSDKIILGFLGSLKSWHGVQRAVEAMPVLLDKHPDFRLLIIGDGNERVYLEKLIIQLNLQQYVYITGFLDHDQVPGALSMIDIALAPYENMEHFYFSPLKIFEYMAAGKPVIAPPLGQIKELIQDKHSGLLLKENTDKELIESILSLSFNNEQVELYGQNAKKAVQEHFTWTKNAETVAAALIKKSPINHSLLNDWSNQTMKKVAFFLPDINPGGTERVMTNVINGLAQTKEYKIQLILMEKKGSLLNAIDPSVEIFDLDSPSAFRSIPKLKDYLLTEKPDLFMSSKHYLNIASMIAKKRSKLQIKMVLAVHGNFFASSYAGLKNKIVAKLLPLMMKMLYRGSDKIIAVSNGVKNNIMEIANVPSDQVEVIYNPVILEVFPEKVIEPLNCPQLNKPYLISVGRLAGEKNFPLLIKAYSQSEIREKLDLAIVGDGDKRNELEQLIRELNLEDRVHLLGHQDNPLKFMAHAECFVLSSNSEGLPTVLIEALYAKTPIISTDCPSGPDEILEGGKYGMLVPVGDEGKMTDAMNKIPSMPELFDSEALRERSLDFKLSLSIDAYKQLIKRLIN